jgi:hypothetical protein
MKNKKYLEVDLYNGRTTDFNLQEVLDEEGITKDEFFEGAEKVTSKDGYVSYHCEEVLYIELPA